MAPTGIDPVTFRFSVERSCPYLGFTSSYPICIVSYVPARGRTRDITGCTNRIHKKEQAAMTTTARRVTGNNGVPAPKFDGEARLVMDSWARTVADYVVEKANPELITIASEHYAAAKLAYESEE